jgi:hypothetical protein
MVGMPRNHRASVRRFATVLALSLPLAGCGADFSALFLPMEPTRESIAAPRRELTAAEKEAISDAVMRKLADPRHRDFKWLPLVVRRHDGATEFCGLVSGDDLVGEYGVTDADGNFRDYYARLIFDRRHALTKVDVVAIGHTRNDNIPTAVDSICIQDGYDVSR